MFCVLVVPTSLLDTGYQATAATPVPFLLGMLFLVIDT